METTQGKAVSAYAALAQMSRKPMPSFSAFKLFRLKKALSPIVEFQSEQETKIVEELGGKISENGSIQLEDSDKRKEYAERHKELDSMECEIESKKIVMYMKELPDLSIAELDALEEFIEWKE